MFVPIYRTVPHWNEKIGQQLRPVGYKVQISSLHMYVNIGYIFGFIDALYQADLVIDSAVGR